MPEGYVGGKADPEWWMGQVEAGIEFRKDMAHEALWPDWRRYYRGNWDGDILPINVFFSMLRSMVPRVYFKNPAVSITPDMPGVLNLAFAQLLNRIDNKLLHQMDIKREMKGIVHDTFMFGTGDLKLGFGAEYSPSLEEGQAAPEIGKRRERVEYHPNVYPNMPWGLRAHTGTIIVPDGCQSIETARWVAHWIRRPIEDIKADTRFKNADQVPTTSTTSLAAHGLSAEQKIEMGDMIEIRDSKFRRVIVIAPFSDSETKLLLDEEDVLQQLTNRFNHFPVVYNPDDEVFWGVPDANILEPHQLELNEIRTLAMKHRRLAIVKWIAKRNSIDVADMEKMVSEDVAAWLEVDGDPRTVIDKVQAANVPTDLYTAEDKSMEVIRETIGFSRNQLGEFRQGSGDTTATEAAIVRQASEIRIDERRDIMADVLQQYVQMMHEVIFHVWNQEQVVEVVGPGGAQVWVRVDPAILSMGRYKVKIDPDVGSPRSRADRESRAIGLYQLLTDNPLIDPAQLTRYLLTELEGVEFDDLMQALPPTENNPSGVLDMGQFADLIGRQVQQLPRQAGG